MDRQIVENILGVIKSSTDKSVIIKGLHKLRTDLVKDGNGIELFRDCGGIKPMVRFLNKPHEQILEIALSILGNCCTDKACCKEALECKVHLPLATILKSIPNPVIQCRACRLLGNLGKYDSERLLATHCPAIAQTICQILLDTSDVQTRIMAFRACRFLLGNPQFLKHFLQSNGFVTLLCVLSSVMRKEEPAQQGEEQGKSETFLENPPVVGLKRNQHREKYFEEVARNLEGVRSDIFDHEVLKNFSRASNAYAMPQERVAIDLVSEILNCLLQMSELQICVSVWESLTRNGSTFNPIVFFVSGENKYRSVALKILSNFSKNHGAFYTLSSADAIVAACELLVTANLEKPLSESETRHCINIICMLSPDACNRSKIRRSGAIRKLIAMVRESESKTEISSILYLLNNFEYDNMSMDLMLREGLISVLVKQLNVYLSSDDEYHKKKREEKKQQTAKKRKLLDQASCEQKSKFVKRRDETAFLDYDSPSSSPHSPITPSSPSSLRSMSPISNHPFKFDETASDDETYSPACSDDDDEDGEANSARLLVNENASTPANTENTGNDSSDIMKLLDIACRNETIEDSLLDREEDDEISQDVKLPLLVNLPRSTIDIIENLLFRVTLLTNKRGELGKPETMNTLIKAINIFGCNNNFAGSLTNILLESQFFANVIKQGIAHQLFQLTKIKEMHKEAFGFLETLTCVGESNYGKAELARMLSADDSDGQKRAAITVAYIIKNQRLLYQFLNHGNALSLILNIILSNNCDYTDEAVDAFTAMSKNTLGITVPQITASSDKLERFCADDSLPLQQACDMRFVVHDQKDFCEGVNGSATVSASSVIVEFNKQLLCDTSEVFNTMLNSDFREGKEGEIHIRTYSVSGLKYFLNLIVREAQKLPTNIPSSEEYQALLEAFEMSRVYIIPWMEQSLQQMLIGLLDEHNCLSLFEWSIKNYHGDLTDMAINYYLCSSLSTDAKVKLFRNADYSTYSSEWFQMIMNTVFVQCNSGL